MNVSVLLSVVLAFVWCLVVGEFAAAQVLVGLAFGAGFVRITGLGRGRSIPLRELPRRAALLLFLLLLLIPADVIRSNFRIAARLLRRHPPLRPGILRLPLGREISEITVALEEHVITLTPGQMVIDYSADEHVAYVHVLDVEEARAAADGIWKRYRNLLGEIFG
jgi:multisubunit Na+/H+ antiporter MnhE subunit